MVKLNLKLTSLIPSSLPKDLEGLRGKKALRAAMPLGLSNVGVPAAGALLARRRLSSRGLAPRGLPTAGRSSVSGSLCTSLAPTDDWWYECLRREAVGLVNRDTSVSNMSRNITELLLTVRPLGLCFYKASPGGSFALSSDISFTYGQCA